MGDSWRRSDIVQEISFGYCVKRLWEIKLESHRWYSLYVCIDTLGLIFDIPEAPAMQYSQHKIYRRK